MGSTKKLTLADVLKPFARLQTTNSDAMEIRTVSVPVNLSSTTTVPLLYAESDSYLHSVRWVAQNAVADNDFSIELQNAGSDGTGTTVIGSAVTPAVTALDSTNVYAPADGKSTILSSGQVLVAVCTRSAGDWVGNFQVNYIPIIL